MLILAVRWRYLYISCLPIASPAIEQTTGRKSFINWLANTPEKLRASARNAMRVQNVIQMQ
jgi:hypothetical protein